MNIYEFIARDLFSELQSIEATSCDNLNIWIVDRYVTDAEKRLQYYTVFNMLEQYELTYKVADVNNGLIQIYRPDGMTFEVFATTGTVKGQNMRIGEFLKKYFKERI